MTKPEGPAQEPHCYHCELGDRPVNGLHANHNMDGEFISYDKCPVPATPTPSQPAAREAAACELLNSALTREIENSPCSYEEVIELLQKQLAWMHSARRQEHGN